MNMSYCQFHNTSIDLDQCLNTIEDHPRLQDLSYSEKQALAKILTRQLNTLLEIREDIECKLQEDLTYENCMEYLEG